METKRTRFQGVLNILSFNRHFYFFGAGMLALLFASRLFLSWPPSAFWILTGLFLYGLLMPLVVSAYVYDCSRFYSLDWLNKVLNGDEHAQQLVNIHAGFDETSFLIQKRFPEATLRVFDFYDPDRHTEPAIVRARRVSMTYPGTRQIVSPAIPLPDASIDIVFLLSAVHEIRSHEEKVAFLKECRRVCRSDAKVIMVEHLRDFPNFVAFTVGFTHFFSRAAWRKAFSEAGFSTFGETKFTPFMSIFKCSP